MLCGGFWRPKMSFLVLTCLVLSTGAQESKTYVRRARMEDQASASSGYMYQSDSNGPTSYVHFTGTSGDLSNFGYHPMTIAHYSQAIPEAYESFQHYYPEPYSSYFSPLHDTDVSDGIAKVKAEAQKLRYGYDKDLEESRNFAKGEGAKHDLAKSSEKGEKGQNGFKTVEEYDKGSQGKHNNEEHKGYYSKKGGDKEGHHESSEHYGSKSEAAKGSKGASFSESSGHKKGSKTTGYHKVYHKDEFKKDHAFYDQADKRGHFDKYGNADAHHAAENGAFEKGGHSKAGFQESEQGKKGAYDKGHYDTNDSKFRGLEGHNEYHQHQSDYGKDAGDEMGQFFGYNTGGDSYY